MAKFAEKIYPQTKFFAPLADKSNRVGFACFAAKFRLFFSSFYKAIQNFFTEDKHIKNNNFIGGFLVIAVLLAVGLACTGYGTKLDFNGGELYYTQNATESDARKLGDYLVKEGFFDGKAKTVQLDKSGSTYQVRIVIQKEKQNDPSTENIMKEFAAQISKDVFGGASTEIHMCDDQLKTLKVVKP